MPEAVAELEEAPEPPQPPEPAEERPANNWAGRAYMMRPLVVLALPGMYLFYKYNQFREEQREIAKRKRTERQLQHLNQKIDKILSSLEKQEPEIASSQEDECVICVNAQATVQTAPCGHQIVCKRCFVKTIQIAVSQRSLPLRCVMCRAKISRLKQTSLPRDDSMSGKSWVLPNSASEYSMGRQSNGNRWSAGKVPASASLYSMTSGSTYISGVSSVSSATTSSGCSAGSFASSGSSTLGKPSKVRQPKGATFRKTQTHSMKMRIQDYHDPIQPVPEEERRLPPIKEFQRDYRVGRASTRIRCAEKIVSQLERTAVPRPAQPTTRPASQPTPRQPQPSTSKSSATTPTSAKSIGSTISSAKSDSGALNSASKAATKSTAKARSTSAGRQPQQPQQRPLTVAQEVQRAKKEKERVKELEKAEKARQKEEEKAEKARQKEAKKLAKEEKKRAKKEAKASRKENDEALLISAK